MPCRVPVCKVGCEITISEDHECPEVLCGLDIQVRDTAWWKIMLSL